MRFNMELQIFLSYKYLLLVELLKRALFKNYMLKRDRFCHRMSVKVNNKNKGKYSDNF